jgi:S1-C subfamily serine protease
MFEKFVKISSQMTIFIVSFVIASLFVQLLFPLEEVKQKSWENIINDTIKSSVYIIGYNEDNMINQGSGFVIDKNGYILTAKHVVEQVDKSLWVGFKDGNNHITKEVWLHENYDLALLKIDRNNLVPLQFSNKPLQQGEEVATVVSCISKSGVHFNFYSLFGRVSKPNVDLMEMYTGIEDLKINIKHINNKKVAFNFDNTYGNSGAPVINKEGKVVSVLQAISYLSPSISYGTDGLDIQKAVVALLQRAIRDTESKNKTKQITKKE